MAIFGSQFYHQTLRRYIVTFGNMFNDMVVQRLNVNNTVIETIGVPISYAPKEKFLARLSADPNLTRAIAVQLPAVSFEITAMQYDGSRKLPSVIVNRHIKTTDADRLDSQYTPVPYNINFSLYMYVRNADDGAQLLEQIIPFFGPEWTNKVILIPSMSINMDIPTILTDVTTEDTYEGDFYTRRALIYTLNFVMKGYFFGPVRHSGVITRTQIDIGVPTANSVNSVGGTLKITAKDIAQTGRSSRIVVVPGLLANGSPTTNSAASISRTLIFSSNNYGLAVNTFFFTDGKKYDPKSGTDTAIDFPVLKVKSGTDADI